MSTLNGHETQGQIDLRPLGEDVGPPTVAPVDAAPTGSSGHLPAKGEVRFDASGTSAPAAGGHEHPGWWTAS